MMSETLGLLLAFAFGLAYNWLIGYFEKKQVDGLTGLWVVGGVLGTLIIAALVQVNLPRLQLLWLGHPMILTNPQHAAIYIFKFMAASGLPMVLGSLWRHWRRWAG
jgi:hypothetical protein